MIIKSIEFKEKFLTLLNPEKLKVEFDPRLQFITGPNGYGKTTISDLIYQMILRNDIEDRLKERVGWVCLTTDLGTITYDRQNGLQKNLSNNVVPQIYYKRQENNGFLPTPEEVQIIVNNEDIRKIISVWCDNREEPIIDLRTGKLSMKYVHCNRIYPFNKASISIQNLVMMYLFAMETREGDILLLEHPEEHLHIEIQLDLMRNLERLCKGQIIVTTHSPDIFQDYGFERDQDLFSISKKK